MVVGAGNDLPWHGTLDHSSFAAKSHHLRPDLVS
jgi:dihydrofolate reductase